MHVTTLITRKHSTTYIVLGVERNSVRIRRLSFRRPADKKHSVGGGCWGSGRWMLCCYGGGTLWAMGWPSTSLALRADSFPSSSLQRRHWPDHPTGSQPTRLIAPDSPPHQIRPPSRVLLAMLLAVSLTIFAATSITTSVVQVGRPPGVEDW